MILVIGYAKEQTLAHFVEHAQGSALAFRVLDIGKVGSCRRLEISANVDDLWIQIDDEVFDLAEFSGIYTRHYYYPLGTSLQQDALLQLCRRINAFLEHAECIVVNRPSAASLNARKIDQTRELQACGFSVPRTQLIGCPATAEEILRTGSWVSKACSGIKTKTVLVDSALKQDLDKLRLTPSQFQQRITGYDVRLHVVGDHMIPLRIDSEVLDYRFSERSGHQNVFNGDVEIPLAVRLACREYCRKEKLIFGGFDFKVDAQTGEWHVLECNPMPGYEYFDRRLDGRISQALCKVLEGVPYLGSRDDDDDPTQPFISADRRPDVTPF